MGTRMLAVLYDMMTGHDTDVGSFGSDNVISADLLLLLCVYVCVFSGL
jgi:hypothetical protein